MPAPSDPEKYSIDEMMDRLKNRTDEEPLEDGELVTRPDGSQAIKVRKRKRRSQQPHKEMLKKTRRSRMIQVSAALLLLLTAVFMAGAAIVYANSAPFRENVTRMIGESTGAKVELEEFRVNPSRAVAGRLVLNWPRDGLLRELKMNGVSASIAPAFFMGKSIHGDELVCMNGAIQLDAPEGLAPAVVAQPSPVQFKRYTVSRLQAGVGNPARPAASLVDTEASYQAVSANGRPQLLLNRGRLQLPMWPLLRLDRAHIELADREIDVVGMSLLHESDDSGSMELVGTARPYANDQPSTFDVRVESFLTSGIIGPDLGRLFSGRVETQSKVKSNFLAFTPGSEDGVTLVVTVRKAPNSSMEIQGFPFMSQLALMLRDKWFQQPVFDNEVNGTLRRQGAEVTLEDLYLMQKARMALRGQLKLAANRLLTGTLDLGLPDAMIQASGHPKLDAVFGPDDAGFRWLTLEISGIVNKPTDNFIKIVEAARPRKETPAPAEEVPTFEELTQPE